MHKMRLDLLCKVTHLDVRSWPYRRDVRTIWFIDGIIVARLSPTKLEQALAFYEMYDITPFGYDFSILA